MQTNWIFLIHMNCAKLILKMMMRYLVESQLSFFGAFGQLPHVGDSLMYSDKPSAYHSALHVGGHHVFVSFKQSVT